MWTLFFLGGERSCYVGHLKNAIRMHRLPFSSKMMTVVPKQHNNVLFFYYFLFQRVILWFAVGCYYYCMKKYDQSHRYFRCHLLDLYIGMEYMRTHSFKLADQVMEHLIRYYN